MNRLKEIDEYIEKCREIEIEACQELRNELYKRLFNEDGSSRYDMEITVSDVVKGLNFVDGSRNDFRIYVWLIIHFEDREYWITTFMNDLDELTGNPHTQIGRIQFWKNLTRPRPENKWCYTPSTLLENGKWMLNPEKSFDPNIKIYDDDYDCVKVINLFIDFLKDNGEDIK